MKAAAEATEARDTNKKGRASATKWIAEALFFMLQGKLSALVLS